MVIWAGVLVVVPCLLAMDLGIINRKSGAVHPGEAFAWTVFWIAVALGFNAVIYVVYKNGGWGLAPDLDYSAGGRRAAFEFFAAYLLAKLISLENIFVIAFILGCFRIPAESQYRVLFWGIIGGLVMRGTTVVAGAAIIERFAWATYVFGLILFVSAVKILIQRHRDCDLKENWPIRAVRRMLPATDETDGGRFYTRIDGAVAVTPLFLALFMVEMASLRFAVDSVPGIFAVSREPFIGFTATAFAVLGLRSLYFTVAGLAGYLRYIRIGVAFVLGWAAIKLLLMHEHFISLALTLEVAGGIMAVAVLASVIHVFRNRHSPDVPSVVESRALVNLSWDQTRRVVAITFGSTLILLGVAMLVLPGPGLATIAGGLAVLSTEVMWARVLLNKVRKRLGRPERPLNNVPREEETES